MRRCPLLLILAAGLLHAAEPLPVLEIPAGTRFINGTGQMPIIGATFKAPGFTSQGYIEICENAGPNLYFVGLNSSAVPLTIRNSCRTFADPALKRITYARRNQQLALGNGAEETVVQPWEFYVSDPLPLSVKAGDRLVLRTFVPLAADTVIGCGIISVSSPRPVGKGWPYGNVVGAEDLTLEPDLEPRWKPTSDGLYVPFLVAGEGVRPEARFMVALGDSLTFQNGPDEGNSIWFQKSFRDVPHCNTAIGGDGLGNVLTADGELRDRLNRARFAILRHATDVVNFYGHNDLGNGRTVAAMLNLESRLCARPEIAKARKWRCTLTPFTHNKPGVDVAQLTEADQTPDRYAKAIVEFNREMRTGFAKYGYNGIIDIGATLATGPDSLFWKPNMASDGTHFGRVPASDLIIPEARKILSQP